MKGYNIKFNENLSSGGHVDTLEHMHKLKDTLRDCWCAW